MRWPTGIAIDFAGKTVCKPLHVWNLSVQINSQTRENTPTVPCSFELTCLYGSTVMEGPTASRLQCIHSVITISVAECRLDRDLVEPYVVREVER